MEKQFVVIVTIQKVMLLHNIILSHILVQISLNIAGYEFPRNSKDQFNYLNNKSLKNIERGCLIFWNGHVAIAIDTKNIIHSNAYHLLVVTENFYEAQKRIKNDYGDILGIKKVDY